MRAGASVPRQHVFFTFGAMWWSGKGAGELHLNKERGSVWVCWAGYYDYFLCFVFARGCSGLESRWCFA